MRPAVATTTALLLLTLTLPANAATPPTAIDGKHTVRGRTTHTLAGPTATTQAFGAPHVFYHDTTVGDLRHTWRASDGWRSETVDSAAKPGPVAVTKTSTRLHVFYADGDSLRAATYDGTNWQIRDLTPPEGVAAIAAVVYKGVPNAFFVNAAQDRVYRAWQPAGQDWKVGAHDGVCCWQGRRTLDGWGAAGITAAVHGGILHVMYGHVFSRAIGVWDPNGYDQDYLGWWRHTTWAGTGPFTYGNFPSEVPMSAVPRLTVSGGMLHLIWAWELGSQVIGRYVAHEAWDGATWSPLAGPADDLYDPNGDLNPDTIPAGTPTSGLRCPTQQSSCNVEWAGDLGGRLWLLTTGYVWEEPVELGGWSAMSDGGQVWDSRTVLPLDGLSSCSGLAVGKVGHWFCVSGGDLWWGRL